MNSELLWTGLLTFSVFWIYSEISKWLFHRKSQTTQSFHLTASEENEWSRATQQFRTAERKVQILQKESNKIGMTGKRIIEIFKEQNLIPEEIQYSLNFDWVEFNQSILYRIPDNYGIIICGFQDVNKIGHYFILARINDEYNLYPALNITPKTGLLVMFPAYLYHGVLPSLAENRITMSGNIVISL